MKLLLLLLLVLLTIWIDEVESKKKKKNVLYIVFDDLRPDLKTYGVDFMSTPHIGTISFLMLFALSLSPLSLPHTHTHTHTNTHTHKHTHNQFNQQINLLNPVVPCLKTLTVNRRYAVRPETAFRQDEDLIRRRFGIS